MTRAERIISVVTNERGVLLSVLMSECQSRTAARARAEIAYRLHAELGFSLAEIGRILDRHHTSVLAMIRKEKRKRRPNTAPTLTPGELDSWAI